VRQTLEAWVHWVKLNPIDDDQLQHARETEKLIAENAALKDKLAWANRDKDELKELVREAVEQNDGNAFYVPLEWYEKAKRLTDDKTGG
jgi:hypothetical protein